MNEMGEDEKLSQVQKKQIQRIWLHGKFSP